MHELTCGSLFSGIGGFDLGLERAGLRTVWFCEQDEFCRAVLARHWPGVPCYPDVRALVAHTGRRGVQPHGNIGELAGAEPRDSETVRPGELSASIGGGGEGRGMVPVSVPYVDVLCGGFPCQDISLAGKGAGIGGARSGLWGEFARLIGELRPRYVVVENVPAITSRGLDVVLSDLAACGFDAEWDHIPAAAFGAPHRRDRFWLVAYPGGERRRQDPGGAHGDETSDAGRGAQDDHVAGGAGPERLPPGGRNGGVPDPDGEGPTYIQEGDARRGVQGGGQRDDPAVGGGDFAGRPADGWWAVEPDVGRVAHGVPHRVDRLRALGNSLVPQIAEWIGRRIVQYETEENKG